MDVQNISAATATSRPEPVNQSALDYDAFLQLMIAQMRNQDPTDPMDPTAQMAQIASFSQVEQAIGTNVRLDALLTSSALAQADGVIGRQITSADGKISGEVAAITIRSDGGVAVLDDGREVSIMPGVEIR